MIVEDRERIREGRMRTGEDGERQERKEEDRGGQRRTEER